MRLDIEGPRITVTLSRRNLLTGLHKLEMEGSARGITREFDDALLILRFEDDAEHYADRRAGTMHPETEVFLSAR